jgi:site-specific DNA recombinase
MPSTNGHGPKRAILYTRVSTDEQARSGYSLAQQLEALRDYAEREGYEVLEEVADPGQSGASLERPGMDRVRDLVVAGGVSVVLAQDRDRFAREPAYHYLLRREFEERGVRLRALNDRGDDSPEGELTDGVLDQLAKYERAKFAERTRRGKLRRAREGKVLPTYRPDFGFGYNAERTNYVVKPEEMALVRRIIRMIGVEGVTIHGVKRTLEREGIPSPEGKRYWGKHFIRGCIRDDAYRAHTFEEIAPLVAPEVAAKLDPEKRYGIWWFNRERVSYTQVAEDGADGRQYRKRAKHTPRPRSEWIAVPVPDSGIPTEWVDAAREAIAGNTKTSKNGGRFWQLSGGILRCGGCGWTMKTTTVKAGSSEKRNHYYRCVKHDNRNGDCTNRKCHRGERVESRVWEAVSGILKDPEQLRADLDAMIEMERGSVRGDAGEEASLWADKLYEVERKRARYQEMAASDLITFDELRSKLAELGETRDTAERELEAISDRRLRLEELERDRDSVLDSLIDVAPQALDSLTAEERNRFYKLLKLEVIVNPDGSLEVSGAFGDGLGVCESEPLPLSPSWASSSP